MSRPAGFKITHWTDVEIDVLKRLRALGKTWREIGDAVGRTGMAAKKKWDWVQEEIA